MQTNDPMDRNGERSAGDAGEGTGPAPDIVGQLEAQLKAAKDEQLRLLAEMDNQRKRLARDVEAARRYGAERVLSDLLPVSDSLEAGVNADARDARKMHEGMELTLRLLVKALESNGIAAIDPAGQPFNPEQHQAMTMVETEEYAPNTVVTVFQKGYRLGDRLLRPALVSVAKEMPPDA